MQHETNTAVTVVAFVNVVLIVFGRRLRALPRLEALDFYSVPTAKALHLCIHIQIRMHLNPNRWFAVWIRCYCVSWQTNSGLARSVGLLWLACWSFIRLKWTPSR
eukprot:SAG31_NODE_5326_length_2609_cov_1.490837_4_plen_105_part_00